MTVRACTVIYYIYNHVTYHDTLFILTTGQHSVASKQPVNTRYDIIMIMVPMIVCFLLDNIGKKEKLHAEHTSCTLFVYKLISLLNMPPLREHRGIFNRL